MLAKGLASLANKLARRAMDKYDVPAADKSKTAVYRSEFLPYPKEFSKTGIGSKKPGQYYSNDPYDSERISDIYSDMIKGVPVYRRAEIPTRDYIRGAGRAAKEQVALGQGIDPGNSLFSEMKMAMQFAKQGLPGIETLREVGAKPGEVISGIAPLFTEKQLPLLLERIKDPAMRKIILKLLFGRTAGLKIGGRVY